MTVAELMTKLAQFPADADVRIPDSYWQSEGYGKHANDLDYCDPLVGDVYLDNAGYVEFMPADPDDGWDDEDEDEWGDDDD